MLIGTAIWILRSASRVADRALARER